MYTDAFNTFSTAQAVNPTGTTTSTNVIDLSAPRDIANGTPVKFFVAVTTSFAQTGVGTVTFEIVADTSPLFTANPTVVGTVTVPVANLLAGTYLAIGYINYDPYQGERYLQAEYIVAGTTLTAGAVTAGLVRDVQADEYYPSGINVTGV